ncbi:universal stress protein [Desulfopila inferna]|uniref:universal stress protein n=1 Tax=Desulfopila inferna TaxID=468528 RepID=UPI001966B7A4|nr:universal stress protein [Desulfopila inferna]MBM9603199.1 universal stress protein [Desulfopila inferna]
MDIKKLFSFGRKKHAQEFQLAKLNKQKPVAVGEMAAGNLTAAANDIARMLEQQNMATKILAVQDGEHSTALVNYVVKMAQKLDCEIVALDVSEEPLLHSGARREREINRFSQRAQQNAETMHLKAETMGVKCNHIIRVGNQEETIKALSQDDKSIRYVLIKPAQEQVSVNKRQARVPVVDLNCSSL